MTSSLLKWLHGSSAGAPLLMAINDQTIQIAQLSEKEGNPFLRGLSEIALPEGVVKQGIILNSDAITEILPAAIMESGLEATTALVAVPFGLTYTFVKDYPHAIALAALQTGMMEHIRLNCPLKSEEMSLEFHQKENDGGLSFGAIGISKVWTEKVKKNT